jgi:two-component system, sensor histidine kinase PdtaS
MLERFINSLQFELTIAYFAAQMSVYAMLTGLIMLTMLAVIINFYSTTSRAKKNLRLLNEKIYQKDDLIRSLENENKFFLNERKVMIKEMHDRVINNLQIVASLLNTQSSYLKNEEVLNAMRIIQRRLYAISLIHHILNQSEDFSSLNIRNYTYALVEYLVDRMNGGTKIHFEIQIEDIYLDLAQGAPVGLILHEAIANAIAYGFPIGVRGIISVSMTRDQDRFLLTISDNGVGLSHEYDVNISDTFGFRLMEGLTRQLGGHFKMENLPGVKIEVLFMDIRSSKPD